LLQKELLEIAHEQIALTNENIRRRNELIKSGKMAQGEIYELEAQHAREEQNRVQTESNLKLALLDLATNNGARRLLPPRCIGTSGGANHKR